VNPKVCPHCQKACPENYQGRYCIHCGAVFGIGPQASVAGRAANRAASAIKHPATHINLNWWIVFAGVLMLLLSESIVMALIKHGSP